MDEVKEKVVLRFPRESVSKPIISTMVKNYDVEFNILKASITPKEEGLMVIEFIGREKDYNAGIGFLKENGIEIVPLQQDITRNDDRCFHCGACTGICPSGALHIDRETYMIIFDPSLCVACELCVRVCPPRAMKVEYR